MPEGAASSIEVKPHALTESEAQRIAQVIFGDAPLYETVFVPQDSGEKSMRIPCQWKYYPLEHYLGGSEELYVNGKKQILAIDATTERNGMTYKIVVTTRDEDDFLLNNINVFLDSQPLADGQGNTPVTADLCDSKQPTDAQIKALEEKSKKLLEVTGLGKWKIVECYAEEFISANEPAYRICVNAVPNLGEVDVIRYPHLQNVATKTDNVTEYLLTDAHFEFSGNGDLMVCTIQSPIDIVHTNEPVSILDFDALMSAAKTAFSAKDYGEYAWQVIWDTSRNYNCKVNVTGFTYGLTRTEVHDNNKAFIYVPSVTFYGDYRVYDADNDTCVYNSETIAAGDAIPLLVLNANDGTVVTMQSDKLS